MQTVYVLTCWGLGISVPLHTSIHWALFRETAKSLRTIWAFRSRSLSCSDTAKEFKHFFQHCCTDPLLHWPLEKWETAKRTLSTEKSHKVSQILTILSGFRNSPPLKSYWVDTMSPERCHSKALKAWRSFSVLGSPPRSDCRCLHDRASHQTWALTPAVRGCPCPGPDSSLLRSEKGLLYSPGKEIR